MIKISKKILKPTFIRKDKRGTFYEILNDKDKWKVLNIGKMKKNSLMGKHYHKKTDVFFFLTKGKAKIDMLEVDTLKKNSLILKAFEGVMLRRGVQHTIRYLMSSEFIMLKSRRYYEKDRDIYSINISEH